MFVIDRVEAMPFSLLTKVRKVGLLCSPEPVELFLFRIVEF